MPETMIDKPNDSSIPQEADAYLNALLRYTGEFYGAAIEHGMPAGHAADCVAHVETAARRLHELAAPDSRPFDPAEFGFEGPFGLSLGGVYWTKDESWHIDMPDWMPGRCEVVRTAPPYNRYLGSIPNSAAAARIIFRHLGVEGV